MEILEKLRNIPTDNTDYGRTKRAAVLIPLTLMNNELMVLLTLRSKNLRTHANEVAFPGGKLDDIDKDIVEAALREANEEIGLDPNVVEVINVLPPSLSKHGLLVTPVLGIIPNDFQPTPNEEVESCFLCPLSRFLKDEGRTQNDMQWDNVGVYRLHYFKWLDYSIWGLTARILIDVAIAGFGIEQLEFQHKHDDQVELFVEEREPLINVAEIRQQTESIHSPILPKSQQQREEEYLQKILETASNNLIDIDSIQKIRPLGSEQNRERFNEYKILFADCEQEFSEALKQTAQLAQPSALIVSATDKLRQVKDILKQSNPTNPYVSPQEMHEYLELIREGLKADMVLAVPEFVISAAASLPPASQDAGELISPLQ